MPPSKTGKSLTEATQFLRKEHLSAIVDSHHDAIISGDLNGTIKSWNTGAERLFGYSTEEAIGQNLSIIVPERQWPKVRWLHERLRRGERVDAVEADWQAKDGRPVHISLMVSPIKDESGQIVGASAIARDITELRRTRLEKEAGDVRNRLLLEATAEAIYGLDNEGNCSFVNPSCVKLLGYESAEELLGQDMHNLIHHSRPDGSPFPVQECSIYQTFMNGRRVHLEEDVVWRKDGGPILVEIWSYPMIGEDDQIVGAVVTLIDVAERRQAEETSAYLSAIVESSHDAIISKTLDGIVTSWNSAAASLYGYTAEEMIGQPIMRLVPPERSEEVQQILTRLRRGERVKQLETVRARKDGTRIDVSLTVSPIKDSRGRLVGGSTIARDITQRRRAEQEIQEGVRRRDQFLAMLSHELRNPLSAVRTATRVLNSPNIDGTTAAEACRVVDRQTLHMTRLLDDLLDVSRITQKKIKLRRSLIDLRDTVEDAVQSVRALANEHRIEINVAVPDGPVWVKGDAVRLQQVQANLLTNAIKYSPEAEHVRFELSHDGNSALIRVVDNGSGIAPEMLGRIFDIFVQSDETLDRAEGGMGVGLTLVHKLVELHGGTVIAQSAGLGRGSTFEVRLPLADQAEPVATVSKDAAEKQLMHRVLVIEDNDDNRNMLTSLLELEGFNVHGAANALDGLDLLNRVRPDAAIIDIGLPEIDGYEVARRIRAQSKLGGQIKLVALTGYGQPQDIERALAAGFNHHLVKPLQPDKLVQALRTEGVKAGGR